jgi:hypothetical protein
LTQKQKVIYQLVERIIVKNETAENTAKILESVSFFIRPTIENTKMFLNLLHRCTIPEVVLYYLPYLVGNTVDECTLVLSALEELVSAHNGLLLPAIDALLTLDIPSALPNKHFDFVKRMIQILQAKDFPPVIRSLLLNSTPRMREKTLEIIRKRSIDFSPSDVKLLSDTILFTLCPRGSEVKSFIQSLYIQKVLYAVDLFVLLKLIESPSLASPYMTFTQSDLIVILIRCILRNQLTLFALKMLLQDGYFDTLCGALLIVSRYFIQCDHLLLSQWAVHLLSLLFMRFPTFREQIISLLMDYLLKQTTENNQTASQTAAIALLNISHNYNQILASMGEVIIEGVRTLTNWQTLSLPPTYFFVLHALCTIATSLWKVDAKYSTSLLVCVQKYFSDCMTSQCSALVAAQYVVPCLTNSEKMTLFRTLIANNISMQQISVQFAVFDFLTSTLFCQSEQLRREIFASYLKPIVDMTGLFDDWTGEKTTQQTQQPCLQLSKEPIFCSSVCLLPDHYFGKKAFDIVSCATRCRQQLSFSTCPTFLLYALETSFYYLSRIEPIAHWLTFLTVNFRVSKQLYEIVTKKDPFVAHMELLKNDIEQFTWEVFLVYSLSVISANVLFAVEKNDNIIAQDIESSHTSLASLLLNKLCMVFQIFKFYLTVLENASLVDNRISKSRHLLRCVPPLTLLTSIRLLTVYSTKVPNILTEDSSIDTLWLIELHSSICDVFRDIPFQRSQILPEKNLMITSIFPTIQNNSTQLQSSPISNLNDTENSDTSVLLPSAYHQQKVNDVFEILRYDPTEAEFSSTSSLSFAPALIKEIFRSGLLKWWLSQIEVITLSLQSQMTLSSGLQRETSTHWQQLSELLLHIYLILYYLVLISKQNRSLTESLLDSLCHPSPSTADKTLCLFNEFTRHFHKTNESAIAFLILSILSELSRTPSHIQTTTYLSLTALKARLFDSNCLWKKVVRALRLDSVLLSKNAFTILVMENFFAALPPASSEVVRFVSVFLQAIGHSKETFSNDSNDVAENVAAFIKMAPSDVCPVLYDVLLRELNYTRSPETHRLPANSISTLVGLFRECFECHFIKQLLPRQNQKEDKPSLKVIYYFLRELKEMLAMLLMSSADETVENEKTQLLIKVKDLTSSIQKFIQQYEFTDELLTALRNTTNDLADLCSETYHKNNFDLSHSDKQPTRGRDVREISLSPETADDTHSRKAPKKKYFNEFCSFSEELENSEDESLSEVEDTTLQFVQRATERTLDDSSTIVVEMKHDSNSSNNNHKFSSDEGSDADDDIDIDGDDDHFDDDIADINNNTEE